MDRETVRSLEALRDEMLEVDGDHDLEWADKLSGILSAIDRPAPVVEVRKLEWRNGYSPSGSWYGYQADTDFGLYEVGFEDGVWAGIDMKWEWEPELDRKHPTYRDLEAAKAACQSDFARRISECITVTTRDEVIEGLAEGADELNVHHAGGGEFAGRLDQWLRSLKGSAS